MKTYWMTNISLRLKKNEEYLEVKSINTLVYKQHKYYSYLDNSSETRPLWRSIKIIYMSQLSKCIGNGSVFWDRLLL